MVRNIWKPFKDNGYVYLVEKRDSLVKIGCTTKPKQRISSLQCSNGKCFVQVFVSREVEDYKKVEKKLHFLFKERRVKGEWYNVSFNEAKELLVGFTTSDNFKKGVIYL